MSDSPGSTLEDVVLAGRYRVQGKLGSGGTGIVYRAFDELATRTVALKIVRTRHLDPGGLENLQREFRSIASLRHRQIATAYDFGYSDEGLPFYTREYVEGRPLRPGPPTSPSRGGRVASSRGGGTTPADFLRPLLDVLDALEYLHGQDVLHLDIHAGNVIESVRGDRGSVLIDLGLMGVQTSAESTPLLVRASTAPELLRGEAARPATDLFAVGRLLLYRLTGSPDGDPKLPREIPSWGERLTLDLERIVSKALQPDPERRFQSAAVFREALSTALGERPDSSRVVEPREVTCGRDDDIALIESALRDAARGQPAVAWFSGPTGIGKSRLLTEARLRAQLRGMRVVEARFFPDPVAEPPLLEVLRSGGRGRHGGHVWLRPLAAEYGGSSVERAQRAAENYFAEGGDDLILILDDFHLADRDSRLLAEALLERCARHLGADQEHKATKGKRGLAIVAASRGAPPPPLGARGMRRHHRRLKPLPSGASRELFSMMARPLEVPAALLDVYCRAAGGYPLRLRRIARALHRDFGRSGVVPRDAPVPEDLFKGVGPRATSTRFDPAQLEILRTLAIMSRPASRDELGAVTELPAKTVRKAINELVLEEIVTSYRRGRSRLYNFSDPEAREDFLSEVPPRQIRRMHERLVRFLRSRSRPDLATRESLARHALALGVGKEERRMVLETVDLLRNSGFLENAQRLLKEALSVETSRRWCLRFAEEISALYDRAGDHHEGVAVLEPVYKGAFGALGPRDAVRIRRRLGVHFHRAGRVERALEIFGEVAELADPRLDVEEIVMVDSELAELRTLRGEYAEAELACQRGLDLLDRSRRKARRETFWRHMEVTLRASLGHLELRRMNLRRARQELAVAARLARAFSTANLRSLILNNLGIVHNQLNEFVRADRCFRQAERLLLVSGERRGIIQIACNRALIAAKTGDSLGARQSIERAFQLLQLHPDARLEFFVRETDATVACFLGDMNTAAEAFRRALPLGRGLGDIHMVHYGEVFFAEALLACGHYGEALGQLQATARKAGDVPLLRRMLESRRMLLETLLGRRRSRAAARKRLASIPRTGVEFLEAWNDLHVAVAAALCGGESLEGELERLSSCFQTLAIPAGRRFAQVVTLYAAMARRDTARVRTSREAIDVEGETCHRLLAVLEPLAVAEASFFLGEMERTLVALESAAGSIVGLPFLELDWRIEFVRARVADRQGDREGARQYLHRSLHTRDLLARSLRAGLRKTFVEQPRFAPLTELARRLEKPSPRLSSLRLTGPSPGLAGIVGCAPAMVRVFQTIQQLSDSEISVLVRGETGTGKDLVARAIHEMSPRRYGPFLALHCASLPGALFESELFGHERGAYTGAEESTSGLLETLGGGTLLLDEVTSLSLETQAKLLRVVDSRVARRLGGQTAHAVDVRFLASASENLRDAVAAGRFRRDLLYRLLGVEIELPPLRTRREDIELLARHFLAHHARRLDRPAGKLTSSALRRLEEHDWPGNVRELEMLIVRLLVTTSSGSPIDVDHVRQHLPKPPESRLFSEELLAGRDLKDLKRELERSYLVRLFRETSGDIAAMARSLGIKKPALYIWFRRVGIDVHGLRRSL